jgi:uncharacterized protein YcbK (DUF882 family)
VVSAYRSREWNARIGGAANSQHIWGRALDLAPPDGLTIDEMWNLVYGYLSQGGSRIRGLGRYPTWLHIDIRPQARIVYWEGKKEGLTASSK